jgi:integrase
MEFYRDVWILLYCLGGVDVLDLAQMKKPSGDYIYFRRKKSRGRGDEVKIYVTPQAAAIMEKYPHKDRLISGIEYTSVNQYRDLLKEMNLMMNKLSTMAGMSEKLTSKVARHTFATIARNMRYDRELIGVLMGHRQKNVTDIYIMYSQEMIDNALKDVISTSLSHH